MSLLVRRDFNSPARRDDFFQPFEQLWNEFYNDFFGKTTKLQSPGFPKMDIGTENEKFFIKAAVSGFSADDITVEITPENVVRISGKMSEKYKTSDKAKFFVKELCHRQFVKEIQLPDNLMPGVFQNEDGAFYGNSKTVAAPEVSLNDGMLILTWDIVPAIQEKPKNRVIPIKTE